MEDLRSLVRSSQAGDEKAYGELVRRFQDMAYGYAYAILGDFHLAEDAAQEAFIEAYRCLPNLRIPQAFPAWFKRIVLKHCDRLTRGKRVETAPLEAANTVTSRTPGPSEIAERRDLKAQVLSAIRALPTDQRAATTLYYIDGYSQDEIATFLEVPTSTVKSRLYASRQRLRERMLEMVRDTLKSNALPESFTEETLARVVARAAELNRQQQFDDAEDLLHDVLEKSPNHPGALVELNRALMQGRVSRGAWNRLPELVEHGRAVLASGSDDEYVYRQTAKKLLLVPAMPEAIEFLEEWIAKKGPNLERLGMLAWAKGCVAEYDIAESLWQELLTRARGGAPEEVVDIASMACGALVDCFASAGEGDRAARVAQAGWDHCRELGEIPDKDLRGDYDWLPIFHQAGLPRDRVAQALLERLSSRVEQDLRAQGVSLSIRAWVEEAPAFLSDWLAWAQARVDAGELQVMDRFRLPILRAFRNTERADELCTWGQATWNLIEHLPGKEAAKMRRRWDWMRFFVYPYIETGDLDKAEEVAYQGMQTEQRYDGFAGFLVDIAAKRGEPSPPELVKRVSEGGAEAIDSYFGWGGWYLIAREAAAAGEAIKAFDALRRALSLWTNPPLTSVRKWENDAYWGDLRDHPEYKRIFEETRRRIGPIYGDLHYFPGW